MESLDKQVITTPFYWDCECDDNYIHPKSQTYCIHCSNNSDGQPDSRVNEVRELHQRCPQCSHPISEHGRFGCACHCEWTPEAVGIRLLEAVLTEVTFALESVAHLRSMEKDLLPVCDKARDILALGGNHG
jgi:hypothetical protein